MPPKNPKLYPPTAKLTLTSQSGLTVTISTIGSTPGGSGTGRRNMTPSTIAAWTVYWGDGQTTSGTGTPSSSLSHTYASTVLSAIIHFVLVDANTRTAEATLTVAFSGPTAVLVVSPNPIQLGEGLSGLTVGTVAGQAALASWALNWGDGTDTGTGVPPLNIAHTYGLSGVFHPALTVTDADGKTATANVGTAVTVTDPIDVQVGDASVYVGVNDDLQAALDAAVGGTTVVVRAGSTRIGHYLLPNHNTAGVVTVQTDGNIPPTGTRIAPAQSGLMPKFQSPDNQPVIATAFGAARWRLIGLELLPNVDVNGTALGIGDYSQTNLAAYPESIVLDRLLIRGDATVGLLRGIGFHARNGVATGCYVSDIKHVDRDSQAIWVNGPGPYTITNNYLEAAGENFLSGGADLMLQNGIPTDITFEDNTIYKPLAWMAGSPWSVKNLFELKNAVKVRIRRNIFQNSWADDQSYAIVFTPRNQDGKNPWAKIDDVIFEYNRVLNVSSVFNILGTSVGEGPGKESGPLTNLIVRYNLAVTNVPDLGGDGRFMLSGAAPASVTVAQNTAICSNPFIYAYDNVTRGKATGWVWTNNLTPGGIIGENPITGGLSGTAGLDECFAGYDFGGLGGNVLAGQSGPAGNNLYPTLAAFKAQFVDYNGGNYQLINGSAYAGKGADFSLLP